MILNGLLHTHIQRHGRLLIKVAVVTLIVIMLLSACSVESWVGDGRGDWTIDLYGGYAISKINSKEILLVYKENPNASGGSIILPNYYVTAYQLCEPYICLEGVCTQEMSASYEELDARILSYYLIDTTDGEVYGPLKSQDSFLAYCRSLGLEMNAWQYPAESTD